MAEQQSFSDFMREREQAARAYVSGDAQPLLHLAARENSASFFAPRGGKVSGSEPVRARYEQDVSSFQPGGDTHFEVLQQVEGADVAYWVGFQHATVRLAGSTQAVAMSLRVTELFRREGGRWKLVHRHADSQTEAG